MKALVAGDTLGTYRVLQLLERRDTLRVRPDTAVEAWTPACHNCEIAFSLDLRVADADFLRGLKVEHIQSMKDNSCVFLDTMHPDSSNPQHFVYRGLARSHGCLVRLTAERWRVNTTYDTVKAIEGPIVEGGKFTVTLPSSIEAFLELNVKGSTVTSRLGEPVEGTGVALLDTRPVGEMSSFTYQAVSRPWDQNVPKVTGGLSLLAFVATLVLKGVRAALKREEKQIATAPEDKRVQMAELVLRRYGVPVEKLEGPQVFEMAKAELKVRERRFNNLLLTGIVVTTILAAVAAYSITRGR